MSRRISAGLVLVLLPGVLAIPACNKKDDAPTPPADGAEKSPEVLAVRDNLRQIGEAMHSGHTLNSAFPGGYYGPDGKTPGLSWRVALLPYIGESALHKQFKLDEPWDSEHNKKLIAKMPEIYASVDGDEPATTYFRTFVGKGAFLDPTYEPKQSGPGVYIHGPDAPRFGAKDERHILDGYSNTLMVVEAAEAVIWTKPDELAFKPDGPLPKLGGVSPEGTSVLLCDGSVSFLKRSDVSPELLKALITINGGEGMGLPDDKQPVTPLPAPPPVPPPGGRSPQ